MRFSSALVLAVVFGATACRSNPGSASPAPELARAPWSGAAIASNSVPPVYLAEWRAAENRSRCALLAPAALTFDVSAAQPRAATFGGGWAVAYDMPGERSAFGVAGTGASAWSGTIYDDWPHKRVFADSSRVGYGPETASATNWLAYVRIPGQECLYNVWSRRGRAHLESLLGELRFVKTS